MQMAEIILAEVVAELERRGKPQLCSASVLPGNGAPLDLAGGFEGDCGGMAYVQVISATPSTAFPTPDSTLQNCAYSLAYNMTVGLFRPIPTVREVGAGSRTRVEIPKDEESNAATAELLEDMDIMHTAIRNARKDIDMLILGAYSAEGPNGGVAGGTWTLQVGNEDPE